MIYAVNKRTKEHVDISEMHMTDVAEYLNGKEWIMVEADPDGWIEWHGGECPLPEGQAFEVKDRLGDIEKLCMPRSNMPHWRHQSDVNDFIAYRPILGDKPQWVPEVGERCVYKDDDGAGASTASGSKIADGEEVSVLALFTNGNEWQMAVIEDDSFACTCVCIEWLRPLPTEEDRAVEEMYRDAQLADCVGFTQGMAKALYRAGYRKQPQPA